MIRFTKTVALLCALTLVPACATQSDPNYKTPAQRAAQTKAGFEQSDMVQAVSTHLGVTSESAASLVERLFKDQGRPNGYITGEESGGAFIGGVFYGKGTLWMKDGRQQAIYWQGPTIGWDAGIDGSKVFALVYGLNDPNYIYQRFPKAEGSAFLIAGMGVNYQRANGIVLAPIRSGVGIRLGANVGYASYTRKRNFIPL